MNTIVILICTIVSVTDADTFRCNNGHAIRLYGIDAPEVRTPEGDAAKEWATEQWLGKSVVCEITGASFGRLVGTCAHIGESLAIEALDAGQAVDVCGVAGPVAGRLPRYC